VPSRRRRRWGLAALALAIAAVTGVLVWCSILYPVGPDAAAALRDDDEVEVELTPDALVLRPANGPGETGLVFVPGAKVPAQAYADRLRPLASAGTTVVVVRPVLNIAFFDRRPLDAFTGQAPGVTRWFVGGHSVGGVRACDYAAEGDASGLVLWGAYCARDLSGSRLPVLEVVASEDGLSTPEEVRAREHLLPADARLVEIEGANHAQFGDYGDQPGDGLATTDDREVRRELIAELEEFVRGSEEDD